MEISYDEEADAMYIQFREGDFGTNKKIDNNTIINFDKKGNIFGIELLSVKNRIPPKSLSEISFKNLVKSAA